MTTEDSLREQLFDARLDCPTGSLKWIIPQCNLDQFITRQSIIKELNDRRAKDYTLRIFNDAQRLFAILVCLQKSSDIFAFLDDGVTDEDLPFTRSANGPNHKRTRCSLEGKTGRPLQPLHYWNDENRENFQTYQQWMTAPIFRPGKHYDFQQYDHLPLLSMEKELEIPKRGGYGEIFPRAVAHDCHFDFDKSPQCPSSSGSRQIVAVKRLLDTNREDFDKEKDFIKSLKPHKHLTPLLFTYQIKTPEPRWHLVFPWADGNLEKYWLETNPSPEFDPKTLRWFLKQIIGLVDGLKEVHICNSPISLAPNGPGGIREQDGATLQVEVGEERYGRHGDIKPQNILFFMNGKECILKLADFGLGRFHGRDSRSKVDPR